MGNDEVVIGVALISAIIVLIAVKIIEFFVRFNDDTRYITREMRRAYDDGEYRYWRRELRCHYLCLIPFVNERNVMRLYKRIFHKAKHGKAVKRSDGLYHILAPSAIAICICAVCLCGVSWAWFTASQTSSVAGIHTATYTVDVTALIDETQVAVTNNGGTHTIEIENNKTYEITITANGTANTGFCTVALGEHTYHTPQIEKNNSFTFEVNAYQNGILTITPQWGTCAASEYIVSSDTPLNLGTNPDNSEPVSTVIPAPQQPVSTSEVSTPKPDDTTEPADTPQGEENNTTTPNVDNTQPETTLPEDKTEPVSEETTASEPTSTTDDTESTEAENTTE